MAYGAATPTTFIFSQCLCPLLHHSVLIKLLRSSDICHCEDFITLFELVPQIFVGNELWSIEEASLFYVLCYQPFEIVFEIVNIHLFAPEHSTSP